MLDSMYFFCMLIDIFAKCELILNSDIECFVLNR